MTCIHTDGTLYDMFSDIRNVSVTCVQATVMLLIYVQTAETVYVMVDP